MILENAADRGTRVHAYCESYALGLFVEDIDNDCKNYVEVFKKWFDQTVEKILFTETRLNSPTLKVSGQFDLMVILKGDSKPSIIDLKTPAQPLNSWRLQTAAYQMLCDECLGKIDTRRICLLLPKIGDNAKVCEYEDHALDQYLFSKAVQLYRFFKG